MFSVSAKIPHQGEGREKPRLACEALKTQILQEEWSPGDKRTISSLSSQSVPSPARHGPIGGARGALPEARIRPTRS